MNIGVYLPKKRSFVARFYKPMSQLDLACYEDRYSTFIFVAKLQNGKSERRF